MERIEVIAGQCMGQDCKIRCVVDRYVCGSKGGTEEEDGWRCGILGSMMFMDVLGYLKRWYKFLCIQDVFVTKNTYGLHGDCRFLVGFGMIMMGREVTLD